MTNPPDVTPLAAVVPFRRIGEVVPRWEATLPGFLRSLFLAVSEGTARTYLEALTRYIQAIDDPTTAQNDPSLRPPRPSRPSYAGPSPAARVVCLMPVPPPPSEVTYAAFQRAAAALMETATPVPFLLVYRGPRVIPAEQLAAALRRTLRRNDRVRGASSRARTPAGGAGAR
jgi:hypothetical protein